MKQGTYGYWLHRQHHIIKSLNESIENNDSAEVIEALTELLDEHTREEPTKTAKIDAFLRRNPYTNINYNHPDLN